MFKVGRNSGVRTGQHFGWDDAGLFLCKRDQNVAWFEGAYAGGRGREGRE